MTFETYDDLGFFLETDEFATTATYTPSGGAAKSIKGIFDQPRASRNASDMLGIVAPDIRFVCRTADVPSAADGDSLKVGTTTYVVRVVLTDGVGMTTLVLEDTV